jgi:hypothetical protein
MIIEIREICEEHKILQYKYKQSKKEKLLSDLNHLDILSVFLRWIDLKTTRPIFDVVCFQFITYVVQRCKYAYLNKKIFCYRTDT